MCLISEIHKMQNRKKGLCVITWIVTSVLFGLVEVSFAYEGAGYAPESIIPMHANESYAELAKRVLPADTRLLYDPIAIDFGADKQGLLLIMATDKPARQYRIWYLSPQYTRFVYHKIMVREPEPSDEFFDWHIHHVFCIGPEGARDLVLLEEYTPPPGGGESRRTGSVYRRAHLHAMLLKQAGASLDNVRTESEARKRLEPWVAKIPTPEKESLIEYFLEAPVEYIPSTKLERWQLIKEGSPRILVRDLRNDYVHIAGDAGLPGYILAFLRVYDKSCLFVLQTQFLEGQHTVFLKRVGNQWQDVSSKVLPDYQPDADYRIPSTGTDLTVYDPHNNKKYILKWNHRSFVYP